MRKIFIVMMLAVIGLSLIAGKCFAVDATEANNPEAEPFLMYGLSPDRINIKKMNVQNFDYSGSILGSGFIRDGACRVGTITLYSDTTGDLIGIRDWGDINDPGNSGPDWLEFEIAIAANTTSVSIDLGGVYFRHGIHITSTDDSNCFTGVVYDY